MYYRYQNLVKKSVHSYLQYYLILFLKRLVKGKLIQSTLLVIILAKYCDTYSLLLLVLFMFLLCCPETLTSEGLSLAEWIVFSWKIFILDV